MKQYQNSIIFWVLTLLLLMSTSCSVSKGLSSEEKIYKRTNIEVIDAFEIHEVKDLEKDLEKLKRPGSRLGFLNLKTGFYNIYDETKEKGFKHWVKHKVGREPILYTSGLKDRSEDQLEYYLKGKGFFNHTIDCVPHDKQQLVDLDCAVQLNKRFKIDSVIHLSDSLYSSLEIPESMVASLWNTGAFYDRDALLASRISITQRLNNTGFADFKTEHVYFYVDTILDAAKVNLYVEVLPPKDGDQHRRYELDSIKIYPNYVKGGLDSTLVKKELRDRVSALESIHYLNDAFLNKLVMEKPSHWYNRSLEAKTVSRLLDIGLFKFVNVKNEVSLTRDSAHISQSIFLTPELIQSVSAEVELNNRSGNFFGTGGAISYKHRNLFRHAENLDITFAGELETQFADNVGFINSSDFRVTADLTIPRMLPPLFSLAQDRKYLPRTIISTNYTSQRRVQFYSLQSLTAKYGFRWKPKEVIAHEFYPIVINEVLVKNKSDAFQAILDDDIRLRRSFGDVLIAGLQYKYSVTNQINNNPRQLRFVRATFESAGNILGLFGRAQNDIPKTIVGIPFAQFSKFTFDLRHYFPIGKTDIATRFYIGAGFSYGNSSELPYTEQFVIGGSNSLRAFPLRGLGPGLYEDDPSSIDNPLASQFIDRSGDMKIELNAEYRFPIVSYLKGAVFVDAGNVWLIGNETQPIGNFKFDSFLNQIAVGTGLGFRLDFDFFLIRLDVAFPLRSPVFESDFDWQLSEVDPFSSAWRQENLNYNLGIGYPF